MFLLPYWVRQKMFKNDVTNTVVHSNSYNTFNYSSTVIHSAVPFLVSYGAERLWWPIQSPNKGKGVVVYKALSIHKQTNLTKWRCIEIKIQMFITSRSPKQGDIIDARYFVNRGDAGILVRSNVYGAIDSISMRLLHVSSLFPSPHSCIWVLSALPCHDVA